MVCLSGNGVVLLAWLTMADLSGNGLGVTRDACVEFACGRLEERPCVTLSVLPCLLCTFAFTLFGLLFSFT